MKAALLFLPATLDATYERMLTGIEETLREEALVLLRWIAYAQSPPSLGELAEARIVYPVGDGKVDVNDRGSLEDTLDILSGLVTVDEMDHEYGVIQDSELEDSDSKERHKNCNAWYSTGCARY